MTKLIYAARKGLLLLFGRSRERDLAIELRTTFESGGSEDTVKALEMALFEALSKTDYYAEKTSLPLSSLPITTKHFRQVHNRDITNRRLFGSNSGNTGGSTGEPLSFQYGIDALLVERAHQEFLYGLYGVERDKARIVSFSGTRPSARAIRRNVFWKRRLVAWPFGCLDFSSVVLTPENVQWYAAKHNSIEPNVVRGYPSSICEFIELTQAKGLHVCAPDVVLLTSEVITNSQISRIKEVWNCNVICQYGMTEAVVFGFTYGDYPGYYCSPLYGRTEVLDDAGNHVKVGEVGRIVATSYSNLRQPFVRYDTGDLGRYDGEMNGFVKISQLEGRASDYLINKMGRRVMLVGLVFGYHAEVFARIRQWQVVQVEKGSCSLRLHTNENWQSERDEKLVRQIFTDIDVSFEYDAPLDKTRLGKRPFLIQKVNA